jgi:TetR/AcrR family transcriptional regulator, cholesterol catabolism regulator
MELRDKIIEEAGKLFVERGTRLVTMDTIAQTMGISKRTIYENFKDKNDLLSNFLVYAITNYKRKALDILKDSKNVIEALFRFGEFNYSSMKEVNPCFMDDIKKYHPEVFLKIEKDGHLKNYEVTYTILKKGINEGSFLKEIDIEIANLFIHHMMEFFQKMDNDQKFNQHKILQTVHLPYLRGISTEKGQELITGFLVKYKNAEIK